MIQKLFLPGAAIAAALVVAAPSLAQPAAPAPDNRPGAERQRWDPAEMAQKRAQRLRDMLQLTPAQEPALTALMEAMKRPEGAPEARMRERGEMRNMTTPQRLDQMRDRMARRQAEFDRRAMAIKRFYAQLSPAQQKAFDAMGPMKGGMGGMGGMGGKGHGAHRGHGDHRGHGGPDGKGMGPGGPG